MEEKKNVYQKIAEVMKEVQYLNKDDTVEFKTTKYKGISEEKVTMAVRKAMLQVGLVIVPVEQVRTKNGQITAVDTKYRIQNIDDPDDYVIAVSCGEGADTQDKGTGKAMTYSYKYLLLRTFAIPTGEDSDKIASAELDAKMEAERKKLENKTKQLAMALYDSDKSKALTYWNEHIKPDANDIEKLQFHVRELNAEMERKKHETQIQQGES